MIADFITGYTEAMLFFGCDDRICEKKDLAPETVQKIEDDCHKFWTFHGGLIHKAEELWAEGEWDLPGHGSEFSVAEYAGHDFWLTRNRSGAGFWDGDWPASLSERLTSVAHSFGEVNLYRGDDGLLYLM